MRFIRHRLLVVIIIGVITSALSLTALVKVISVTTAQRRERAHEALQKELDRLAAAGVAGAAEMLASPPAQSLVGMRGGYCQKADPAALPAEWRGAILKALSAAAEKSGRSNIEEGRGSGQLLVAAEPAAGGGFFWAGYLILPPQFFRFWLTIVILLSAATALLFSIAVWAVVSFQRSAEEQERLGRELAQNERLAALGRVVAGVAHEVRNPLASIKLRLDLAAAGSPLPQPAAQAIAHATAEITRLDRLVADLLVVAGRQVGPRTRTSLGALVRSRADALGPWASTREVSIHAKGDGAAVIDAEKVGRAIDNLLRNAVEASPPNGEVAVSIEETKDEFLIRVEDEGPGVQSSAQLFEPFYTTKSDGTGLGLAICRAIARAHGGDVVYTRIARGPREPDSAGDDAHEHHAHQITRFQLSLLRAAGDKQDSLFTKKEAP
jgi:signal transduction histidine kinase